MNWKCKLMVGTMRLLRVSGWRSKDDPFCTANFELRLFNFKDRDEASSSILRGHGLLSVFDEAMVTVPADGSSVDLARKRVEG